MVFNDIRNLAPRDLKRPKKTRILNPAHVLLFFLFETVAFLTLGFYLQMRFENAGIVMTELGMLAISLGFVKLMRADARDVFPIRRPRAGAMWGSVIIWIGAIMLAVISNIIMMYLFPDVYLFFSESESELGQNLPVIVQLLMIAVLPAICEEALHRGVIQSGIQETFRNRWAIAAIMGGIFAVFHIYPIRYPNMFILGAVISLVMAETRNMVYPCFIHFLNNAFSVIVGEVGARALHFPLYAESYLEPDMSNMIMNLLSSRSFLGLTVIFYGIPAPILLYTGNYLVRRATAPQCPHFLPKGREREMLLRILIPTAGFLVAGILLIVSG